MSIRLTLMPFPPNAEHSHTLLGPIEPTLELRGALKGIAAEVGRDVPLTFNTYFSEELPHDVPVTHYGNTQEDLYGDRLKHVSVCELLDLFAYWEDDDLCAGELRDSWLAHASWAYLSHLPSEWRVALYWH